MSDRDDNKTPARLGDNKGAALAKLSMPRLAGGVARPRLFKVLDEARRKSALWIVAPGGAGKTTLVTTYIAEHALPFLWCQLDADDADPATFFYYLGLAAKKTQSEGELHLPLLTPEYLLDISGFSRRYFRDLYALLPPGTVLVLDNYQDLGESAVFSEIMRHAIGEIPEGIHLMVVSRSDAPPELARHQVTGALGVLDWEVLRLTFDETEMIATHGLTLERDVVRVLHERSEGWVAGLILFLEQIKRTGGNKWDIGMGSLETVFHFFANEFFNDLPESRRDFLLKTALLPHMTQPLAEALSGNSEAGEILTELHRHYFFTNRRELTGESYRYHALLREFLLVRAAETYTRAYYLELTRRAGCLLGECGRNEEALALHLRAQDWETATSLLLTQAPQLLAQGRAQIVVAWLQQLPEELVEATPWLLFWRGVSQQFVDPLNARSLLERAYSSFESQQDVLGQMSAASAIIEVVFILRESLSLTLKWVDVLQQHLHGNLVFPSLALEAGVLSSLVSALELTRPDDPLLPQYAARLMDCLEGDIDANRKIMVASRLVIYMAMIRGDAKACDQIMLYVSSLLKSPDITALSRHHWKVFSVLPFLFANSRSVVAAEAVRSLLEFVRGGNLLDRLKETNLVFLEFITSWYAVLVYLHFDELKAARPLLDRMATLIGTSKSIDMATYTMVKSLYALRQGDLVAAHGYGEISLDAHFSVGAMITGLEMSCILAIERCESGEPGEALTYLESPKTIGWMNSPRMRHQVFLIEAYAHLLQGKAEACHACLRQAFAIGYAHHCEGNAFWLLSILPRLCAEALRAGIEPDYVRQLIQRLGLLPEDASLDSWPWPVRVYTLGQFNLLIDEQPVADTKAQRKPLKLLEVLIALGGVDVRADRIAEIVWPDAEGDAALSAFTTTLSRLRRLVGDETISVKGGRVSLDERRCWVDVRALERILDRVAIPEMGIAIVRELGEKLLSLYRGPFLGDEEGEWPWRLRNRLRTKFSRGLSQCVTVLRLAGETEMALQLLESAIDADPGAENLYRNFIPGFSGP